MPCFHPLSAWRGPKRGKEGPIYFDPAKSFFPHDPARCALQVRCGQCLGCRIDKRQEWSVRMMHEFKVNPCACFVTLTISDEHMPPGQVVPYRIFQLFMKRLRKRFSGVTIRFVEAFEYGTIGDRPHFHAILYGVDFSADREPFSRSNGSVLYTSKLLEQLWGLGICTVGEVTRETCQYVAGYTMKEWVPGAAGEPDAQGKYHGVIAKGERERVMTDTGEIVLLPREHIRMSRRPGIGAGWFKSYFESDVVGQDRITILGKLDPLTGQHEKARHVPVPAYYIRLYERENPEYVAELKAKRKAAMQTPKALWNNSPERLAVRKACLIGRGVKKRDAIK